MTRFVAAKWTSLAVLLSAAVLMSGCETTAGKPTICTVKGKQAPCTATKKTHTDTGSVTRESGGY
jgi:hypothetical protein